MFKVVRPWRPVAEGELKVQVCQFNGKLYYQLLVEKNGKTYRLLAHEVSTFFDETDKEGAL
jgi:hypothetical protein